MSRQAQPNAQVSQSRPSRTDQGSGMARRQGEELGAEGRLLTEGAIEHGCSEGGASLSAAHLHTQVVAPTEDGHVGVGLVGQASMAGDGFGEVRDEPLLDLEPMSLGLSEPHELGQADDAGLGEIAERQVAGEGQEMMLAHRPDTEGPTDNEFVGRDGRCWQAEARNLQRN